MLPALLTIAPVFLAAAYAASGLGSKQSVKYVALGGAVLSLLAALAIFAQGGASAEAYQWFAVAGMQFGFTLTTSGLHMMLLLLVSLITPLVFAYSIGFMELPSEQRRFYAEMGVFAASMMLFAVAGDFITLFVAWEMLGVTSYLLIGFWYRRPRAPYAARKAITTILLGDICLFAAIVMIGATYHTFSISAFTSSAPSPAQALILVLALAAVATKSAQFPFHEWLPDAMEGPTPVSAFLHSSTMVKAGVFLVMLLLPAYAANGLLPLLLAVGMASALLGAANAIKETHVKKILAYSTIEDLGLMMAALGLGSLFAAVMLFIVQAFYKALIFMGAGAAMKANDEREDIGRVYGSYLNLATYLPTAIAVFSIAGIFPFSGFVGKGLVDSSATGDLAVYALLALIGIATNVYIFRWLFLIARRPKDDEIVEIRTGYASLPMSMRLPMALLALAVIAASATYLYAPGAFGLAAQAGQATSALIADLAPSFAMAIIGIGIAYAFYVKGTNVDGMLSKLSSAVLYTAPLVNAIYFGFVKLVELVSVPLEAFDFGLNRSTYALADGFVQWGDASKGLVKGRVNGYAAAFAIGIVVLFVIFML